MGYTHYWDQNKTVSVENWGKIVRATEVLLQNLPPTVKLALEYNRESEPPAVTKETIRFNGVGDRGCETFVITRKKRPLYEWEKNRLGRDIRPDFCKTAREPYDLAVCVVLTFLQVFAGDCFEISSDGDKEDWAPAQGFLLDLCKKGKFPSEISGELILKMEN